MRVSKRIELNALNNALCRVEYMLNKSQQLSFEERLFLEIEDSDCLDTLYDGKGGTKQRFLTVSHGEVDPKNLFSVIIGEVSDIRTLDNRPF